MTNSSTEIALKPEYLKKYIILSITIWTIIFVGFITLYITKTNKDTQALATTEAKAHFNKDLAFRYWATEHGGVYVPTNKRTPPNPYLSHLPERDIETPSGKKLTLMNPAYMLKQLMSEYDELYGIKGHITSLNPLNPENAPDEWERKALINFEKGQKEVFEFSRINSKPYLRLIQPMVTKEKCLKCHKQKGYKTGDIRGGVSISIPLEYYNNLQNYNLFIINGLLGFIWLLGLIFILWLSRKNYLNLKKRMEIEKQLRNQEKDLIESQKIAHLGSWHLDLATNQVSWTDELYKMYGFDPTLPPPPYTEHKKLFTPESWERLSKSLAKTSESGTHYELELETVKKDGSNGWMWVRGEAVRDSLGNIVGLWGAAQDITERKQTEIELIDSESRFQALHNVSFGGILIHDKGLILECNKGVTDITGYSYNELIGMNGLLLFSEDTRSYVLNKINSGDEKPYEAKGARKNGEIFPLSLEARNIPYKGKVVRVVEFRDITAQKQAEKEREHLENQLIQAQKMESVGRLAGGVAHDFNNMLGIILGNTELLLQQTDPDHPFHDELKEIEKAGNRSADLTRQLLAFARKQTIIPKAINLNTSVSGMLKMLRRLIGEDIELEWKPHNDLWPVLLDPSQIDQILANLCVNARDAIKNIGKVTIETNNCILDEFNCAELPESVPGEYILLIVSDNGSGMDQNTVSNIFEPFFTTKGLGKGTGLGLATVYGIVKQNNGFINVYSELEKGTTFKLYFPRYTSETLPQQDSTYKQKLKTGNETILIVEDESALMSVTTKFLEKLGYTILATSSPKNAIEIFKKHHSDINLLITDVIMPEMNGNDLAKKLKKHKPDLKCLFMSGYTSNVISHHGVLEEDSEFISKPFHFKTLASKIHEVLDKEKK